MNALIESLVNSLQNKISGEMIAFIISLFPILELRGGLIAATILGIEWHRAFIYCFIGNMLPIPFILLFIRKLFEQPLIPALVEYINLAVPVSVSSLCIKACEKQSDRV